MTNDYLETLAQRIRTQEQKIIMEFDTLKGLRKELHDAGGSTAVAPQREEYLKQLREYVNNELLIIVDSVGAK